MLAAAPPDASHITVAGRDVALWYPAGAALAAGYPVILFSHGFTGCNTQSTFLMEALAKAGYFVLAPNHQDARCGSARKAGANLQFLHPQAPFGSPDKWSDATYKDRDDDMRIVLDAVLRGRSFQGIAVDPNRVGVAGHSLGGYTVLGLAGGWPSWKDNRIKAVLALSPHCSPFVSKGDLGRTEVAIMYQGGTIDFGETPVVRRPHGAYDLSSAPKYYVELAGAGHFAWTDLNKTFQEVIDTYSVAFFDRYLKDRANSDPLAPLMKKPLPARVASVRSDLK